MTPMIDVVFLLLIFFMVVSQVSRVNSERLELPKQKGTEDQEPTTLIVNVNKEGEVIVSANVISVPELVGIVAEQLAQKGNDPSRLTINLRADARAASRTVNEIVSALAKLDVTQVRIAVEVPQ